MKARWLSILAALTGFVASLPLLWGLVSLYERALSDTPWIYSRNQIAYPLGVGLLLTLIACLLELIYQRQQDPATRVSFAARARVLIFGQEPFRYGVAALAFWRRCRQGRVTRWLTFASLMGFAVAGSALVFGGARMSFVLQEHPAAGLIVGIIGVLMFALGWVGAMISLVPADQEDGYKLAA